MINNRIELDRAISQISGVEFLISCVTGLRNNAKSKNEENNEVIVRKGIAYFIVTKNETIEDAIRKTIYDGWFKNEVTYIRPRSKCRESHDRRLQEIKQVVKVRLN